MAIVIIEQHGACRGRVLTGRTLIGRWASNGIVIDHADVSRLHAWISLYDDGCFVTDAQSRTGTRLNGALLQTRQKLNHGDEIEIGSARLVFLNDSHLPAGMEAAAAGASLSTSSATGIFFDCPCGAPLWAPVPWAGQRRRCTYCHQPVIVPMAAEQAATPNIATKPLACVTCSICQWPIDTQDHATAACPECGLIFHAECWSENKGCASYGCPQVSALAKGSCDDDRASQVLLEPARSWENIWLPASAAASVFGVLAFGVPAAVVGTCSVAYYIRAGASNAPRAAATALLTLLGVAGGVSASYWWWLK